MNIICVLIGCKWDAGKPAFNVLAAEKYRQHACARCGAQRHVRED